MILYHYKCDKCGHEFEELKEIDKRHIATCPVCDQTAFKTMAGSTANANFCPHWEHNIAPKPVYVTSRESKTRIANMLGNYNNSPLCKREVEEIKIPNKQSKQAFFREWKQRKGVF